MSAHARYNRQSTAIVLQFVIRKDLLPRVSFSHLFSLVFTQRIALCFCLRMRRARCISHFYVAVVVGALQRKGLPYQMVCGVRKLPSYCDHPLVDLEFSSVLCT